MPKMDHSKFCKQLLSRIKLSSLVLPIRFLNISEDEWNHIKFLAKKKMEESVENVAEVTQNIMLSMNNEAYSNLTKEEREEKEKNIRN